MTPHHSVLVVAGGTLTISHYGMLTYRDWRGVPINIEMTNDIQNLINTLDKGSGKAPVVTMRTPTPALQNTNVRTVGQGEVQRPYLAPVVGNE